MDHLALSPLWSGRTKMGAAGTATAPTDGVPVDGGATSIKLPHERAPTDEPATTTNSRCTILHTSDAVPPEMLDVLNVLNVRIS